MEENNEVNFGNDWFGLGDNSLTPTPTPEQLSSMSQNANEGVKDTDYGNYSTAADYSFLDANASTNASTNASANASTNASANADTNADFRDEIRNTEFNLQPENEENNYQIGKKKKYDENTIWNDVYKDNRSFWSKTKGTLKETGKSVLEGGKNLLQEFFSGYMGSDLMEAANSAMNNLFVPDKSEITINGKNYKFNQDDDTQNVIMYTLEDLSYAIDRCEDFDDILESLDASLQMNNALASMNTLDLLKMPGQYTLRGSNVKGMAKASEALLSKMDSILTPEYLDSLSSEEIGAITKALVMNTTFSGANSNAISSIIDKLGDRPGVAEGYEEIKDLHNEALAQAHDKRNAQFAADVVMDAITVAGIASGGWKLAKKGVNKLSSKYGVYGQADNASAKALRRWEEAEERLAQLEKKYSKFTDAANAAFDPEGYEKALKEIKQAEKEFKRAEKVLNRRTAIGTKADDLIYGSKHIDDLDEWLEEAIEMNSPQYEKELSKMAQNAKTVNAIDKVLGAGAATELEKSNLDKADDAKTATTAAAKVAKAAAKVGAGILGAGAAISTINNDKQKNEAIKETAQTVSEKQAQKEIEKEKEKVAAIKAKYDYGVSNDWAKVYKEKLDAIDVSDINTDNFKQLHNDLYKTLQDLQKDAKNQIDMIADSFFREGASLDRFTSSEEYKAFSQDVYNLSQDIYDKAETINHSAPSNIQRDYASTSSKISAAFDRLGNKITGGKDPLNDATLAIEYLDSLDAVIDASKALMKSAAYNGAENIEGGQYAEAWKKDTAIDKLSAKEWVASAATGTMGLLGIIGGSVMMAANPLVGGALFALGLAGTSNNITKMSLGTKSFTNEEQMFNKDNKGLKLYNSLLEPANIGDTKAASTYTKLLSGASKIGKGISSLDPSTVASGVIDIYQVESGGLSGKGRELYNNMYQFANIWDTLNDTNFAELYHSDPIAAQNELVQIASSSFGTSDESNTADAKYSGYREEAVNSNLAKDYNEGMEKETNEAVSDKYVKVFKVMLENEPDYIRKVLIAIPKNHCEVEW